MTTMIKTMAIDDGIVELQNEVNESKGTVKSARDLLLLIEQTIETISNDQASTIEPEKQIESGDDIGSNDQDKMTDEGHESEQANIDTTESLRTEGSTEPPNEQISIKVSIPSFLRDPLKTSQRSFILDSFKLTLFQTKFKTWEHSYTANFTETTISQYNKLLGQMAICNSRKESMDKEYSLLMSSVELPQFEFSKEAYERSFGNETTETEESRETQKKAIKKNGSSDRTKSLLSIDSPFTENSSHSTLDHIYSVSPSSPLPFPQFEEFNRLVNAEYRLRIEKRIKYEILEVVRNRLTTSTEKWKARVARLDKFFDGVDEIANEVDTIQAEGYAKGSTHDNNILDESESEDEEERDRLERDRQSIEDREASEERLDDDDEGNEGLEDANIEEEHEAVHTNGGPEVSDVVVENQESISEQAPEQVDPESIAHDDLDDAMIID